MLAGDTNGDGIISALDLAAVKQRLTRRIDKLPVPASLSWPVTPAVQP